MDPVIRVFARRTKWTPVDDLAFYDEPPLFELPDLPVRVSVTFSWDLVRGWSLYRAWRKRCRNVQIGGPALSTPTNRPGRFTPGRFLREGITITSRGCPKRCLWCRVAWMEGPIRELPIRDGHIVQDNNLLACSRRHVEKVFAMLGRQRKAAEFKGGLDIDFMDPWHVDAFQRIRVAELWVACDTEAGLTRLDRAADLLSDFPIEKRRCYAMIGRDETEQAAERRLEAIYARGFLPFAQLYQPPQRREYNRSWRALAKKWSRPAAYRKPAPAASERSHP